VKRHLDRFEPEFVLFQCGADGSRDDPPAHLKYTPALHAHAAKSLRRVADRFSKRKLMAFGGGGYDRDSPAQARIAVLREFIA
jgi:acetoin utilization protein AcuC